MSMTLRLTARHDIVPQRKCQISIWFRNMVYLSRLMRTNDLATRIFFVAFNSKSEFRLSEFGEESFLRISLAAKMIQRFEVSRTY